MRLENKNKKRWFCLSLAGIAALIGGFLVMSTSSATLLSMAELDQIKAGCYCCDHNGSWDTCNGVAFECESTFVLFPPYSGYECDDEGAECKWAPDGDWHGQCESTWWNDTCTYQYEQFCSFYYYGYCRNVYDGLFVYCQCLYLEESEEQNNSRRDCSGDICYI